MGLFDLSTTVGARLRAETPAPWKDFWYTPEGFLLALRESGIGVTPEIAMTLSAVYCAVMLIAHDIATLPCQFFRYRDDGGKDRVRSGRLGLEAGGIGGLVYRLRWQPNQVQTAVEFWRSMVVQLLIREVAYAEILPGPSGFAEQLVPRHPDRITPERLASGRLRYRLREADGRPRYLTQDELFVIRGLSHDGVTLSTRLAYAARSLGSAIAVEKAAAGFFRTGMTASFLASYTGEKDEDEEAQLHASLSRYATGLDNAFGVLLLNDEIKLTQLAIDPEKAQMKEARDHIIREVARWFGMPAHKLQAAMQTESYASVEVKELSYVIGTIRPIVVGIEQAIQRDLILAKDTYFAEFLIEALLRGDLAARSQYYERAIRNRWMRPSEARVRENMNPDPALDRLSEGDFRPGTSSRGNGADRAARRIWRGQAAATPLRTTLLVYDNALRVLRRERGGVEKIARQHPSDVNQWKAELRAFYDDHARVVAQTLRLPAPLARAYAANHARELEAQGVVWMTDLWEREEAEELAALALDGLAA